MIIYDLQNIYIYNIYIYIYNPHLPWVLSFLLVPHLPRLVAWERRTTVADRHYVELYMDVVEKYDYAFLQFRILQILPVINYTFGSVLSVIVQ